MIDLDTVAMLREESEAYQAYRDADENLTVLTVVNRKSPHVATDAEVAEAADKKSAALSKWAALNREAKVALVAWAKANGLSEQDLRRVL